MTHIRHVRATPPGSADGVVARVYQHVEQEFGMLAPPMALHSPAPELLVASWLILRESLLVPGPVSRAVREAVAASVSFNNRCPYCVDVHGSAVLGLLGGPDARALADDRVADIADHELRAAAMWARHGDAGDAGTATRWDAGELAAVTAVVFTFEYLNRMVNVFLRESPLPPRSGRLGRWVAARVMGRLGARAGLPGRDIDLLPAAALPPDLRWAGGRETSAAAFARANAAVERAGVRSVPDSVRRLVGDRLSTWSGRGTSVTLDELRSATDGLPARDRSAGRLALWTAVSSYRVTDAMVDELRDSGRSDAALIEIVSWAAFTAARSIAAASHDRADPRPG
ncbi:carboxymuconolactone decarboxylase family protein [Winogradskya consettensis]|nr:carboxymuconolactone decarboxylase family protein [Actinoplanes consettensis]